MKTSCSSKCTAVVLLTVLFAALPAFAAAPEDSSPPPNIVANDNRAPAGNLQNGVLELKLVIREGFWHPEDEGGSRLFVQAFAEEGKPPQIPGPLLRVPEGAELHVSVHNPLKKAAVVHGLHTRPGDDKTPLEVPPGETREVRFKTGPAGTYFYWASTTGAKDLAEHFGVDSQLAGAIVVDPANGAPPDRVFVLGLIDLDPDPVHDEVFLVTINGKSWPHTERFTYRVGDPVRWRWINTTTEGHPMHLHGSYYSILARSNGETEHVYSESDKPLVVTEFLRDGETMTLEWTPDRAGRWIFHCHIVAHIMPDVRLPHVTYPGSPVPASTPMHTAANHADMTDGGMAGLVVGITVLPRDGVATKRLEPANPRKLQLVAREHPHGVGNTCNVGYALRENGSEIVSVGQMPGPPIFLTRGEPVALEVVNQLKQPTAVHWHGIELESYYDGVAGLGGDGRQVTPVIAPGSSFVARFTPPRAGTFIYHTHWHDLLQLTKGLYGPLIILEPGKKFDPETDKMVILSRDGPDDDADPFLVNGTTKPETMRLRAGVTYRFRLINITPNNSGMTVSLLSGDKPVQWRAIAKDGADLPASQRQTVEARRRVSVGETYDFEFTPQQSGPLQLDAYRPANKSHVITPVEVR